MSATIDPPLSQPELLFHACPRVPSPADLIRRDLMERGISINEIASAAVIDGGFLHAVLAGRSSLSAMYGVRIALSLGNDPRRLVLARAHHEAWQAAEQELGKPLPQALTPLPPITATANGADLLRRQLRARSLSLAATTRAIGMSRNHFVKLVAGDRPISPRADYLLCHLFTLPPATFLTLQATEQADKAHAAILAEPATAPRPARPRASYGPRPPPKKV